MSGITNPAEEYFKNGLWAWDPAAGVWLKLIIDPLTNQLSVAVNNDAEVHQTAPADLAAGAHGWDGSAWRKLPLVWGYSEEWGEQKIGTAAGAGNATTHTVAVPGGYVYVLSALAIIQTSGAAQRVYAQLVRGVLAIALVDEATATSGQSYCWHGHVPLKEDDYVEAVCVAPGDGQAVHLRVWGYKMKVAE